MARVALDTAITEVAGRDPALARLVAAVGPIRYPPPGAAGPFARLARAVDELGVRQGFAITWGISPTPSAKELEPLGDMFRPYRAIVARYCWEAVARARGDADTSNR